MSKSKNTHRDLRADTIKVRASPSARRDGDFARARCRGLERGTFSMRSGGDRADSSIDENRDVRARAASARSNRYAPQPRRSADLMELWP